MVRMSSFGLLAMVAALSLAGCAPSVDELAPAGETADQNKQAVDAGSRPKVFGINIDPTNPWANPSAKDVLEVGAKALRIELKVTTDLSRNVDAEVDEELDAAFAEYDPIIHAYTDAGIRVLMILDYATASAERFGAFDSDGYLDGFTRRAARVAEHWQGRVDRFEIWNEEDLCVDDYCPELPIATFSKILGYSAKAIHDVNPAARVISGGLGSGSWEMYLDGVMNELSAMGLDGELNGVGAHPYTFWPAASGAGGNVLEYQLGRLYQISGKPVWFTEWGDGGSQYAMMEAYFRFFGETGNKESALVEEAYLFAWSDTQQSPPTAFGLFNREGAKKAEWDLFHDTALGSKGGSSGGDPGGQSCGDVASSSGWEGGICGASLCGSDSIGATSDCDACCRGTSRLHGAVVVGGLGLGGVTITAWGQKDGDFWEMKTDDAGIFAFEGLNLGSKYNLVVNASFQNGEFQPIDAGHDQSVRDNVALISGPDGWHGENFELAY